MGREDRETYAQRQARLSSNFQSQQRKRTQGQHSKRLREIEEEKQRKQQIYNKMMAQRQAAIQAKEAQGGRTQKTPGFDPNVAPPIDSTGQAPVANAGAVASMGASGNGQNRFGDMDKHRAYMDSLNIPTNEMEFDQPAQATLHPNQPSSVPAMQPTPIEQAGKGYFGPGGEFISNEATASAPVSAPVSEADWELDEAKKAVEARALQEHLASQSTGGTSMAPGTIAPTFKDPEYMQNRGEQMESQRAAQSGAEAGLSMEAHSQPGVKGRAGFFGGESDEEKSARIAKNLRETQLNTATPPLTWEDQIDMGLTNERGEMLVPPGGTIDTSQGNIGVISPKGEGTVTPPPSQAPPAPVKEMDKAVEERKEAIETERLDQQLQNTEMQEMYGMSAMDAKRARAREAAEAEERRLADELARTQEKESGAAPRLRTATNLEQYDLDGDGLLNEEEYGQYEADSAREDDALAADKAAMDAEEDMTREQLDAFQQKYDAMSGDLPEGYDAEYFSKNPTLRKHSFDEKKYGELVGDLEKSFRNPEATEFFDRIKSEREVHLADYPNAPFDLTPDDQKQLAKYIESFMKDTTGKGTSWVDMPGFKDIAIGRGSEGFSKYFTTRDGPNLVGDPDAEAEMIWSMLKDSGISIENFNQGLKDATDKKWRLDRRRGKFGGDYVFTPGDHMEAMSMFGETEKEPMTIENTVTDSQGNVTGQDGDPAQYDSPDGTKMSGTLDNTTTTNSAGQTWRTDGETSVALAQQYSTDALRDAMGGDLASDAGRAALLAAIDQPLGVPDGYTWDSETGQLTYDMAGMESLLAPGEEATDENLWLSGKKKEDGKVDTKRFNATEEDTMAKALRLRDIATEAYEKATGDSITRQGKLQMAEEQAISREGQRDLDIVKSNAGNYIFKMRGALDSAAKGNLSLLESALAEELPAPPPGLVWNNQSQTFTQRPGFTGRSMDANTQRWMQIAEPTYKMMDRATKVMNEQKKLQMELANSQAAIEESDKRFADAMANDDIETADEILANQRKAETEAITSRTKMEQMTMLMNIVKDPLLLGNAKRYGMLAEMESQLGWATGIISDTVPDVPEGAGIPNYNEWTLMSQEEQIMRKTDWVANGGDLNEFDIMIKSSAPANVQRVDYSIYQETKCHQNYPQYLL